MTQNNQFDVQTVLDGLGQGVLIFGSDGRLIFDNMAARTFLGTDINLIRSNGWDAAATLLNARQTDPDKMIEAYRAKALDAERPVRFFIFRSGEHIPCWASSVMTTTGEVCTMITIDSPDWTAMTLLLEKFRTEFEDAVQSTRGHAEFIEQAIKHHKPHEGIDLLNKRISGFTRLIATHMDRTARLMTMLERMEDTRTGRLREKVRARRRKIDLEDFFEDLLEMLDEIDLVDPETDAHDHRSRITLELPDSVYVMAAQPYVLRILQDILRNAIMYSMKAAPITIKVEIKGQNAQIDVRDEGYGVRERERERVFEAFQRARQPQVFSEFGYGLSLYLCKHEVEAMNGRLWFESEENVGTTFSMLLPLWREADEESSSSDTESTTT